MHDAHRSDSVGFDSGIDGVSEGLVIRLPEGANARLNLHIGPGMTTPIFPKSVKCKPRGGQVGAASPISHDLAAKLEEANDQVTDWLASGEANVDTFLRRPVEALGLAGIELTRSEQKELRRAHQEAAEELVAPPGVKITSLSATAYRMGQSYDVQHDGDEAIVNDEDACESRR